jgi:hypothetical protein
MALKDEIEAMLAAQRAAVHLATMNCARRLHHVENIPGRTAPSWPRQEHLGQRQTGNYRHGRYTRETVAERRQLAALIKVHRAAEASPMIERRAHRTCHLTDLETRDPSILTGAG